MTYSSFLANNALTVETTGGSTTAGTSWVSPFGEADRVAYLLIAEAVGTTLDMKIQQATDSSGTSAKDITDADSDDLAITQLVAADDETVVLVEFGPGVLDQANGFEYVRAYVEADGTCAWDVLRVDYRLRQPGNYTADDSFLVNKSTGLFATGATIFQGLADNA